MRDHDYCLHDWELIISKKVDITNDEFLVDNYKNCIFAIYQCNLCCESYCRLSNASGGVINQDKSLKDLIKYLTDHERELLKKWSYISDIRGYKKSLRKMFEVI